MNDHIVLKPNHLLGIWLLLSDRRIKYVHGKLPCKPRLEKLFLPISDLQYEKIVVLTQTSRELPKENKSQSHQPALNRAKTFHIEFQG